MIKVMIRYRKNSLFFRTAQGAHVGDAMMSLIHTARYNGANVFDYLTALQEQADEVAAEPTHWLPWNYKQRVRVTEKIPLAAA
jgi:transposase